MVKINTDYSIQVRDETAELGVIGTLLLNNDYILKTTYLKPKHFYFPEISSIYQCMVDLIDEGVIEFDTLSIVSLINANKGLKENFAKANIRNIEEYIEDCKLVARNDFKEYQLLTERVITLAFKRDVKDRLLSLARECTKNNSKTLNAFNFELQNAVANLANDYMFGNDTPLLAETIDKVWANIVGQRTKSGTIGIPSKYTSVNKYFTYRKGELVVIGGRAKSGKSVYLSNEAYYQLKNGVKVAIFDTELSDEIWLPRFLANITGLTVHQIEKGNYSEEEETKIEKVKDWIKKGTLIHKYDPEWTMDKIYIRAKQIKIQYGLDVLIYDYIKADDVDLAGMGLAEHSYLGKLTSFLKNKIAGELRIAVISAGQMNDNELRLADSRKIQRYASTIVYWMEKDSDMIARDGAEQGNNYLYVDYNRNGSKHKADSKKNPVTYLNFVMDGDRATINMAKIPEHVDESPF